PDERPAVASGDVPRGRGAVSVAPRGVRRHRADFRLRRRDHGAVPVRHHAGQLEPARSLRTGLAPDALGAAALSPFRRSGRGGRARELVGGLNRRIGRAAADFRRRGGRQSAGPRPGAFSQLPASVRDRLALPARRDDRRGGAREARMSPEAASSLWNVGTEHYLALSLLLFGIGLFGVINRRNLITILMSIELMLNAVNLNLVAFSYQRGDLLGQVFTVFTITVAAGEAAVGLGILLAMFRLRQTTRVDAANELAG